MVCQPSYPLNSENASPLGTFTVYLSCAARAMLPETASETATITTAGTLLPFISFPSLLVGHHRAARPRVIGPRGAGSNYLDAAPLLSDDQLDRRKKTSRLKRRERPPGLVRCTGLFGCHTFPFRGRLDARRSAPVDVPIV